MRHNRIDLSVSIAGLRLNNPVMAASGTFGYGEEYSSLMDVSCLGAIVTKGISLEPSEGNPPPRIVETPSGMLNAIGLHNVGLECFVSEKMPFLNKAGAPVIVNFFGTSVADYVQLARRLSQIEGVAALEANISCPNIKQGGISFGTDPRLAHDLVAQVRKDTSLPLIVKLTPNVTDIASIAVSVQEAGADAVSLTNTFTGMVIDVATRRPALANITGGLSGPAIRPLSLRMVWEVARAVSVPVIGVGGIMSAADALQFLIAGAAAVQVGTGIFVDPGTPQAVISGIGEYLRSQGFNSISRITGSLQTS